MLRVPSAGLGPRLTVDLAALARNFRALEQVSTGALCGAVVKADAYGTGIVASAEALYAAGARFFFTATVDEGLAVRGALPEAHVFILDGLYPGAAETYVGNKLMPCLSSLAMLEEWLAYCLAHNEAYPAAFHFDTGMNRLGFRLNEVDIVTGRTGELGFAPQMVMSHLACADQPNHEMNRVQLALFQSLLTHFPGIPASLANSAGLMTMREAHFQMVRPGIALYGGRAVSGRRNPMQRVVTLETEFSVPDRVGFTQIIFGSDCFKVIARYRGQIRETGFKHFDAGSRAGHHTPQQGQGRPILNPFLSPSCKIRSDHLAGEIKDLVKESGIPLG